MRYTWRKYGKFLHNLFQSSVNVNTGHEKKIHRWARPFATYLSRAVVLDEGCRNGVAEWVSCLGCHVLPHKKSQIH